MLKGNIQKESNGWTLQQFSTRNANRGQGIPFQVIFAIDIFSKIFKLHKFTNNDIS